MNLMRVFLAIELPLDLKEKIFALAQEISKRWKIKLVEKENLHLTLLFLGERTEGEIKEIREIKGKIKEIGEIRLKLGKVEIFPSKGRPRGIWIKVEGEVEKLFSLYKKIVDQVLAVGVRLNERQLRFSPHITIGRIKGKMGELRDLGGEFTMDKIALFASNLTARGPIYSKIAEFEV